MSEVISDIVVHTFVTPSHEKLFTEIFYPSLDDSFPLKVLKRRFPGNGDFMDKSYMDALDVRLYDVIESIRENWGNVIAWADVDILFTGLTQEKLRTDFLALGQSLAFSRLGLFENQVCFGFFVMRCDEISLRFWEMVRLGVTADPAKYDQLVGHDLISLYNYPHAVLPDIYYSHCMPAPETETVLYHAACVKGVDEKLIVLKEVREKFLCKE